MVVGARVKVVAARAKMAMLSTLVVVVVVGVLVGSKLVVAPMVLGLEL
jgi:hypothetical protein